MTAEDSTPEVSLITPGTLRTSLWQTTAHLNYGRKGCVLVKSCTTFPGLSYSDAWDKPARRTVRTFFVEGDEREFASAKEAAKAWNDRLRTTQPHAPA